jgi:ADP-heptose:LPS heptosyltransferase
MHSVVLYKNHSVETIGVYLSTQSSFPSKVLILSFWIRSLSSWLCKSKIGKEQENMKEIEIAKVTKFIDLLKPE